MTDNPHPARQPAAAAGAGPSVRSADILLNLLVILLAPIFLSATDGDIALARRAAVETVNAYRAQSHADLLAVAQIIAFGFATLGSLCLSMSDDISLSMVLRLRGNANALSRSAETHRRRLEQGRAEAGQPPAPPPIQANPPPQPQAAPPAAPPPAVEATVTPAPASTPSPLADDDAQAFWAAAIAEAAEQFTAELPHLSPAEQRMAAIQAVALSECGSDLLPGPRRNGWNPADAEASTPCNPVPQAPE